MYCLLFSYKSQFMKHFQIRNPTLRPEGASHLSEGQRPSYVIDNPTSPVRAKHFI